MTTSLSSDIKTITTKALVSDKIIYSISTLNNQISTTKFSESTLNINTTNITTNENSKLLFLYWNFISKFELKKSEIKILIICL